MSDFLESFLTPQPKVQNLASNVQFLGVIIDPSTPLPLNPDIIYACSLSNNDDEKFCILK